MRGPGFPLSQRHVVCLSQSEARNEGTGGPLMEGTLDLSCLAKLIDR